MTDESEDLRRQMQQFLYAVSHDLQEPLRKVRTFGDRLAAKLEGKLDDAARSDLTRMLAAAERGQGMIEGLLVLSRLESHGGPFLPVDLNAALAEALEELQPAIAASEGTVQVGPLPTVQGDAGQIKLLFTCLIDNALKFHKPGAAPSVRVFAENTITNGMHRVTVEDDGIGVDPQYADRILTVFQRLHPRDVYPGLGLGLAYCRAIVHRHGGQITVESRADAGARLIITLPSAQ